MDKEERTLQQEKIDLLKYMNFLLEKIAYNTAAEEDLEVKTADHGYRTKTPWEFALELKKEFAKPKGIS